MACTVPAIAGPDVVVFDIYNLANWGSSSGTVAYTIGTESCNFGDTDLNWIAGTPDVPVIGQNMYRIKDGRMEQLGQSWLKWAFASLNQDECGNCDDPGTGSLLGPNCSDPYSAGLNGSQSGLGPKSVVNPHTGFHPGSHATPSGPSTIAGRIQVDSNDMDPGQNAGAIYLVEGQYVTPDDAASGNQNNNASYREVFVDGSLDISFNGGSGTSSTVVGKPAIEGWQSYDPSVGVEPFDVPGDGRGYIGWTATRTGVPVTADVDGDGDVTLSDLAVVLANFGLTGTAVLADGDVTGDGNVDLSDLADVLAQFGQGSSWRYEFALHNLNVHRSFVAFELTVPDSSVITDDYFKGVPYHSGEPYANPNWRYLPSPTTALWIGTAYSSDQNAGVCRWGNLYNFGFTAPFGPDQLGDIKLSLFMPGGDDTLIVPLPERNANDNCAKAAPITNGSYTVSTLEATTDGPSEASCSFAGNDDITNDVWYRYTAPCDATVLVDVCDADFDSRIAVYGTNCPAGPGTVLACDDDGCGSGSSTSFVATSGSEYLIRVGGRDGAFGSATLNVVCDILGASNDNCVNAYVTGEGVLTYDSTGANTDGPLETGCGSPARADIWFSYTPTCDGTATVSLCGSAYDTMLLIYDGGAGCPVSTGTYLACNDDFCGLDSQVSFSATNGTEYLIRVAGYNGSDGEGVIDISMACD